MPPFSACSICQVRTRKMVKDPLTLKQIYVCPKCFKSGMHQKASPIETDNLKKSGNAKVSPKENQKTAEKNLGCPGSDKSASIQSKKNGKSQEKEEELLKEVPKVKKIPKITPPLMQTVVIKNRKYVAISETADDE
ncbi:uncharacterized protein LOC119560652 [Drosophila subpulchrella]|uniref:uncharacterized protein LOC119560652 n=1 Tax=Drosophila subpulchrella TaxID=1486046 RepID=UPI0018A164ED|nr:uncharacterized protein LOC119560652 [Drosophila subpulchrella]